MRRNLFFDFNGTIADTLSLALEFFTVAGPRFCSSPIRTDEFKRLSNKEALAAMGMMPERFEELVADLKT